MFLTDTVRAEEINNTVVPEYGLLRRVTDGPIQNSLTGCVLNEIDGVQLILFQKKKKKTIIFLLSNVFYDPFVLGKI